MGFSTLCDPLQHTAHRPLGSCPCNTKACTLVACLLLTSGCSMPAIPQSLLGSSWMHHPKILTFRAGFTWTVSCLRLIAFTQAVSQISSLIQHPKQLLILSYLYLILSILSIHILSHLANSGSVAHPAPQVVRKRQSLSWMLHPPEVQVGGRVVDLYRGIHRAS